MGGVFRGRRRILEGVKGFGREQDVGLGLVARMGHGVVTDPGDHCDDDGDNRR